jgi:hypothetical protein
VNGWTIAVVIAGLAPAAFLGKPASYVYTIPACFPTLGSALQAERETCASADVSWVESSEASPGRYGAPYFARCEYEGRAP